MTASEWVEGPPGIYRHERSMDQLTIANAEKRYIPCEVYSRVVGYLRPVSAWNEGQQQAFADRKVFKMPKVDE